MAGADDARHRVHREAEVVATPELGGPGVQPHADAHGRPARPPGLRQRLLRRCCGLDRRGGVGEDHEACVTLVAEHGAVALACRVRDHGAVRGDDRGVRRRVADEQPGARFDIREEEGHGARGQRHRQRIVTRTGPTTNPLSAPRTEQRTGRRTLDVRRGLGQTPSCRLRLSGQSLAVAAIR